MNERAELLEKIVADKTALQILMIIKRVADAEKKTPKEVYEFFVKLGWL